MNENLKRLLLWNAGTKGDLGLAVDVGAHKGLVTSDLIASGHFSEVVAFEANPDTFTILSERMSAIDHPLTLVNQAVGDRVGSATFFTDEDEATASLLPYIEGYATRGRVKMIEVPLTTIDDYFHDSSKPIGLLKTDTQGNDLAVLQGARKTIERWRPAAQVELIFVPMYENQASPEAIREELSSMGYRIHSTSDIHIDQAGRTAFCDAVFIPTEMELPGSISFTRIDNSESYREQIEQLHAICAERLALIERLDQTLKERDNR